MMCVNLKEEYLGELEQLIKNFKERADKLSKEDSRDEAILETIKANIVDIFYKLFNVSYNKACKNSYTEVEKFNKISELYIEFFNKIPAPWKEKMAMDKQHNMMEEYYKEQIKLETAEDIKSIFIKHYNGLSKEAR